MNCCNSIDVKEEYQTFKNGTKHLRQSCRSCGKFLGFKQQELPDSWIFPFGKYKGIHPKEVPRSYITWLLDQKIKENLKNHLKKYAEEERATKNNFTFS